MMGTIATMMDQKVMDAPAPAAEVRPFERSVVRQAARLASALALADEVTLGAARIDDVPTAQMALAALRGSIQTAPDAFAAAHRGLTLSRVLELIED